MSLLKINWIRQEHGNLNIGFHSCRLVEGRPFPRMPFQKRVVMRVKKSLTSASHCVPQTNESPVRNSSLTLMSREKAVARTLPTSKKLRVQTEDEKEKDLEEKKEVAEGEKTKKEKQEAKGVKGGRRPRWPSQTSPALASYRALHLYLSALKFDSFYFSLCLYKIY